MENPLSLPRSQDPLQQVHDFARDLAYGALQGSWSSVLTFDADGYWHDDPRNRNDWDSIQDQFRMKWQERQDFITPSFNLLIAFGYLSLERTEGTPGTVLRYKSHYVLTSKAFALLERPITPPQVFISYRRDQSSAFALLIEARLKIAGIPNPFIDKDIIAGEEWHGRLEATISNCEYFICLVGKETLASPYVRQEIEWAEKARCRIISIWHGCQIGDDCPEILRRKHAITVPDESAKGYESAVSDLLNSLGYSTY